MSRSDDRDMHPVERVALVVFVAGIVAGAVAWILTGWWGWGLIGGAVAIVAVTAAAATPSRPARDDGEGPGAGVAP